MRFRLPYIIIFLITILNTNTLCAQAYRYTQGDSIMNIIVNRISEHQPYLCGFEGEAYIKGKMNIIKHNFLYKLAPDAFPFDDMDDGSIYESVNDISFRIPNQFSLSPIAISGTSKRPLQRQYEMTAIIGLNIYNNTASEKFIFPTTKQGLSLYEFKLSDTIKGSHQTWLKIRFIPKRKSLKLLTGDLYIDINTLKIKKLEAEGWMDIARFSTSVHFGEGTFNDMLPTKTDIKIRYSILNNTAEYEYLCFFRYNKIDIGYISEKEKKSLDQTQYITINTDSVALISDTTFWKYQRKALLEEEEQNLINKRKRKDTLHYESYADSIYRINYRKITHSLIRNYSFGNETTKLKYSGLFNPSMISYSSSDKIRLRQQLRFRKDLPGDRQFGATPELGYSFGKKRFNYRIENQLLYCPQHLGVIKLVYRSGHKGFSSRFIDEVNEMIDSTGFKLGNLNIGTYINYNVELENSFELTNGLLFYAGVSYNYRKPDMSQATKDFLSQNSPDLIRNYFADFTPYIRLQWTPQQYYRYIGKRKIYMNSPAPTFSAEFAKGLSNIMRSTSRYNRLEFDIHQNIPLDNLNCFSYKFGAGTFFNQRSEYFVNFHYFEPHDYPDSWNDRIGGVFNLLDDYWYYASPSYLQAHVMYESPFMLLHLFRRISRFVLTERLYVSYLYTPERKTYTELGYGMGNYIFNVAGFVSFQKSEFSQIGVRITFELDKYW